jgi:hypothetical protein
VGFSDIPVTFPALFSLFFFKTSQISSDTRVCSPAPHHSSAFPEYYLVWNLLLRTWNWAWKTLAWTCSISPGSHIPDMKPECSLCNLEQNWLCSSSDNHRLSWVLSYPHPLLQISLLNLKVKLYLCPLQPLVQHFHFLYETGKETKGRGRNPTALGEV